MLTKTTIKNANKFCKDSISEIEGYNEAITSDKRYCCHHKLGINVSYKELIEKGLYFNRPANELIFLEFGEHRRLHMQNLREETRHKLSDGNKGKHHTDESKQKISNANKGENHGMAKQCIINNITYGCLKDAYIKINPKYTYVTFTNKYKRGEL